MKRLPIVALGLDAVALEVVDRLVAEGRMPHLAALRERGLEGEVRSPPAALLNSWMIWPSFITGQSVGTHGWHSHKPWDPAGQHLHHPDPRRLPLAPFWDLLPRDRRVALLDVPHAVDPGRDFPGVFVNGWHGPDDFGRTVRPARLGRELRRRHGKPVTGPEIFGPQTAGTMEHQRGEALDGLAQFTDLAVDLLRREPWDLFLAVLGGAHRASHYLWPPPGAGLSDLQADERRLLEGGRDALYEATDEALGRILADAPPDARVLVFALHGMGPNTGWGELFGAVASHLQNEGRVEEKRGGLVYRLKKALPSDWAGEISRRLPPALTHRLIPVWSGRMHDWLSTPWFALPSDLHGNVRVNLRGREAQGVVAPGAEYDALLDRLTEELLELEDLRDGSRVVARVDRMDEVVGQDAPRRDFLPDLVVRFTDLPALGSPGIRSRYGELSFDHGDQLPSGRTGNHTTAAWCIAAGPGVEPGRLEAPVDAVDLTATLLSWLDVPVPERVEGAPVARLAGGSGRGDAGGGP